MMIGLLKKRAPESRRESRIYEVPADLFYKIDNHVEKWLEINTMRYFIRLPIKGETKIGSFLVAKTDGHGGLDIIALDTQLHDWIDSLCFFRRRRLTGGPMKG